MAGSKATRLLALGLCMAALCAIAVPAYAADADPSVSVLGRYVREDVTENVISVGCTWGDEIRFTYYEKLAGHDWNPETLSYGSTTVAGSVWTPDNDNNIRIDNHSNTDVEINFRWEREAGYDGIAVGTSANGFTLASAVGREEAVSRTVAAEVTEGSLDSAHTDYKLMGRLVMGVEAVKLGSGSEDPGHTPGTYDRQMLFASFDVREVIDGRFAVDPGGTVGLQAVSSADAGTGTTFAWTVEGAATMKTVDTDGKNEVEIVAGESGVIDITCVVTKPDGDVITSGMALIIKDGGSEPVNPDANDTQSSRYDLKVDVMDYKMKKWPTQSLIYPVEVSVSSEESASDLGVDSSKTLDFAVGYLSDSADMYTAAGSTGIGLTPSKDLSLTVKTAEKAEGLCYTIRDILLIHEDGSVEKLYAWDMDVQIVQKTVDIPTSKIAPGENVAIHVILNQANVTA